MVDGLPNAELFNLHVGRAVESTVARNRRVRVRAYGEMVDLLWRDGNTQGALRLEELWNDLSKTHAVSLMCAYVMGRFYKDDRAEDLRAICRAHHRVVPVQLDTWATGKELRDVSLLLQHAHALEREIEYRKELEEVLRASLAERLACEDALRRANELKDECLAVVSHELRTPLAAIAGWASILKNTNDRASLAKGLEVIDKSAKAQTRIIEDLLDMSRVMTGSLAVDHGPVSLVAVVAEAVDALKAAAVAKRISLTLAPSRDSFSVVGDGDRLKQVVCNLINNAIKFTPRHGRVDVSLYRESASVCVKVKDNGRGIDPEFLPHVFDRFRQAGGDATRRQGLGLGLAIVRTLMELHDGSVKAESAGPGKGATFTLSFPVKAIYQVAEEEDEEPFSVSPRQLVDLAGVRVLLVDDEADAREVLEDVLLDHGAQVRSASSARHAFELMQSFVPDVLVSDIGMPEEDGYAFIRRIRTLPAPFGTVPAIALTALASVEDVERALSAGFHSHLAKPTDPGTFASAVADMCRQ
jgi:signal transduction histidine kinase